MALRGETVGTAYVRILADGGGLPQSIKDEMHDAEPVVEDAGAEHSKAYEKGWEAQDKKNTKIENSLVKKVDNAMGRIKARSDLIGGDIQERLTAQLREGLADGLSPEHADQVAKEASRRITEAFSRGGGFDLSESNIIRQVDAAIEHITKESLPDMEHEVDRVNRKTRPFINSLDNVSTMMGKAFGKGARNNFVNMVGSMVQGFTSMIVWGVKGGAMLADFAKKQLKVAGNAEVTASAVAEAGAEVAATGPPGWIALAGIIGGVAIIAPIAAAALSSLAAAVTALASSVSFALVGGLGVIAGLLPVIAFGAATVGAAFIGMSDDAKKALKESIKPIKDEFTDLQGVAQEGIFSGLKDAAPDIAGALGMVTPLIKDIADAIGDVIRGFGDAANSKGFRDFIAVMRDFIPDAIRTLGRVFTNTLGGFGGIFEALIPNTQTFLTWIENITGKFQEWANSTTGQNQLGAFMSAAAESGRQLWDLIKKVGEAIGKLLFSEEGRQAGGSIIEDMTAQVQRFIDWLDENPDALKKWFQSGKEIAGEIGKAIGGLIELFDKLDTPENRQLAKLTIGAFNLFLKALPALIEASQIMMLVRMFQRAAEASKFAKEKLSDFKDWLGRVSNAAPGFNRALQGKVVEAFNAVKRKIGDLPGALAAFRDNFREKGATLGTAIINGFNSTLKAAGEFVSDLISKFTGLGSRIVKAIGSINIHWPSIPDNLKKFIPGATAAGGLFVGPQMRLIGEAGPEAVVPLNRPLGQVDPAVRALSAVAQGKVSNVSTNNNGRSIDVGGLTIVTPTKDPAAVARETVNQLVAASYL